MRMVVKIILISWLEGGEKLCQVLDQVIIHSQVHHFFFQNSAFAHERHCILHASFQFSVFFDEFGNLLVLTVDYLLQFVFFFLNSTQFLLVKFLELREVTFSYLMILSFSLLVINARLHGGSLHFCLHLFHARLQGSQSVLQLADLFQLLIPLLLQLLNQLRFLTHAQLRFLCIIEQTLKSSDFPILFFSEIVKRLLQFLLLLGDTDNLTGQSLQLIIGRKYLLLDSLFSILILTSHEVNQLSQFSSFLLKELIIMRFDLSLLEEGSASHQHQTFLVLHLLPEVCLERVHPHPHLQHLGVQL